MTEDILAWLIVVVFTFSLVWLIIEDETARQIATVIAQMLCLAAGVGANLWAIYHLITRFFP